MMRCHDVQQLFGLYWDLPRTDLRRTAVDEHIRRCHTCAEEFEIWEESLKLISYSGDQDVELEPSRSISTSVMERIYRDEAWRVPIVDRVYSLSRAMKLRISAVIGLCLMLFLSGLLFAIAADEPEQAAYTFRPGVVPIMSAQDSDSGVKLALFSEEIPTASITAPLVIDMKTADSDPDFMIVVSILGVVLSLLIMNWLSRLRA